MQNPEITREDLSEHIGVCLHLGRLLFENGAHTHRVVVNVQQLGRALGADRLHVLVTYEAVLISTMSGEDFRTKLSKPMTARANMAALANIARLMERVRRGEVTDAREIDAELHRIESSPPPYPPWLLAPMIGAGCAALCRVFGGDWGGTVACFFAAVVAAFMRWALLKRQVNPHLMTFLCSFTACALTALCVKAGWSETAAATIACSILFLMPGLPLLNAVEDLIQNHIVVGVARGAFGLLVIFAGSLGLVLALDIVHLDLSTTLPPPSPGIDGLKLIELGTLGLVVGAGFATAFSVPGRYLHLCALAAAVALASRGFFMQLGLGVEVASFTGALLVRLLSEVHFRRLHVPATVFTVPGVISIVPGRLAYFSIVGFMEIGRMTPVVSHEALLTTLGLTVSTVLVVSGLAAGVGLPSLLLFRDRPDL